MQITVKLAYNIME